MARDEAYREAAKKIEEARQTGATSLHLDSIMLTELPESIGQLVQLRSLNLSNNQLKLLPESVGELVELQSLDLSNNQLKALPESLGKLTQLRTLILARAHQGNLMYYSNEDDWYLEDPQYRNYQEQDNNLLTDLPISLADMVHLQELKLNRNILNPELGAAYDEGIDTVKSYLRAKGEAQVKLNEAKLILIGEGEVGKTCLLGALRDDPWQEGYPTTHGIEIKTVSVTDPHSGIEITLNSWDFGGQPVYRPTHQLFFSAPAVYLVVWKPREGPQQGFVKEWIKLVKHREPDAKILVVATHGGPGQRQPDVDRQEIWDLFGQDTVADFFHVDSKPNEAGERRNITKLKDAIARIAARLPEMGRSVPKRWQEVREKLKENKDAYLPLERVSEICREHKMDDEEARLFVTISHRLGHLIHYEHDLALRDIVVLKPDWLATAISFVLDDEQTRKAHGLVSLQRLSQLWDDPTRGKEFCYDHKLHPVFLRLMERFDISYEVKLSSDIAKENDYWQWVRTAISQAMKPEINLTRLRYTSLIA